MSIEKTGENDMLKRIFRMQAELAGDVTAPGRQ